MTYLLEQVLISMCSEKIVLSLDLPKAFDKLCMSILLVTGYHWRNELQSDKIDVSKKEKSQVKKWNLGWQNWCVFKKNQQMTWTETLFFYIRHTSSMCRKTVLFLDLSKALDGLNFINLVLVRNNCWRNEF